MPIECLLLQLQNQQLICFLFKSEIGLIVSMPVNISLCGKSFVLVLCYHSSVFPHVDLAVTVNNGIFLSMIM